MYQRYWVEKMTGVQMANIIGCHPGVVIKHLVKHKIPRRSAFEHLIRCKSYTSRTKIEVRLESIFNKYSSSIEYTGDGSFIIPTSYGKLNPDFIVRGKRIAIEANGDYWHSPLLNRNLRKGAVVTYREKYLKAVGWKLVVFWETDILRKDAEGFVLYVLRREGIV